MIGCLLVKCILGINSLNGSTERCCGALEVKQKTDVLNEADEAPEREEGLTPGPHILHVPQQRVCVVELLQPCLSTLSLL